MSAIVKLMQTKLENNATPSNKATKKRKRKEQTNYIQPIAKKAKLSTSDKISDSDYSVEVQGSSNNQAECELENKTPSIANTEHVDGAVYTHDNSPNQASQMVQDVEPTNDDPNTYEAPVLSKTVNDKQESSSTALLQQKATKQAVTQVRAAPSKDQILLQHGSCIDAEIVAIFIHWNNLDFAAKNQYEKLEQELQLAHNKWKIQCPPNRYAFKYFMADELEKEDCSMVLDMREKILERWSQLSSSQKEVYVKMSQLGKELDNKFKVNEPKVLSAQAIFVSKQLKMRYPALNSTTADDFALQLCDVFVFYPIVQTVEKNEKRNWIQID